MFTLRATGWEVYFQKLERSFGACRTDEEHDRQWLDIAVLTVCFVKNDGRRKTPQSCKEPPCSVDGCTKGNREAPQERKEKTQNVFIPFGNFDECPQFVELERGLPPTKRMTIVKTEDLRCQTEKQDLPVLKTVMKQYIQAIECQTYLLADCSSE